VFAWHCILFVSVCDNKFLRRFIQSFGKIRDFENIVNISETLAFHYDNEAKDRLQFKRPHPRQEIARAYQHISITELFVSLLFICCSKQSANVLISYSVKVNFLHSTKETSYLKIMP
jgi:hypothetical protein